MKHLKQLALLIIFASFIACGGPQKATNQENPVPEGWELLNESDYSIQYPKDWELDQSGRMQMSFIVLSKQNSQEDLFRENINLIIEDLTGHNLNLDEYAEQQQNLLKTMLTNGQFIESKKLKINEIDFQKIVCTGDQGIYKLKFEQYYFVQKNKAYVLTLTCEAHQFNTYQEIGEKILNSFKLK